MPESSVPSYEFGGRKYLQRKLVIGQIQQLTALLNGLTLPKTLDPLVWVGALGDQFCEAAAIVLIPEDAQTPDGMRTKDVTALAAELKWALDAETCLQVAEDFFTCNPASSVFERAERMKGQLVQAIGALRTTSPGSLEETPSGAGQLSGAAPPEIPSPMPGT